MPSRNFPPAISPASVPPRLRGSRDLGERVPSLQHATSFLLNAVACWWRMPRNPRRDLRESSPAFQGSYRAILLLRSSRGTDRNKKKSHILFITTITILLISVKQTTALYKLIYDNQDRLIILFTI